jgi:N-methylhydantoinase A/oxoprolinase/acetone carboxylase beta subunit
LSLAARVVGKKIASNIAARGLSGSSTWLFATGGAGGLLATAMAEEAGLAGAMAFPLSPVFSAFGLSRLDLLHAYEAPVDGGDLAGWLSALSKRALRDMRGEGIDPSAVSLRLEAEVSGANGAVEAVDLGDATADQALTERLRRHPGKPRLVRLKAIAPGRRGALETRGAGRSEPRTTRSVAWRAKPESTPVYDWDALGPGAAINGPAIVESQHTTVPIQPGVGARVGDLGELVLTRAKR